MSTLPRISVVIPTFGRPQHIEQCLRSFLRMEYPRDRFELLVVDDGSPEPVEPMVTGLQADLQLRCLRQQQTGPARARNFGLQLATGDLIAFTDDDCRPCSAWLSSLAAAWEENPDAGLAGPVINALEEDLPAEASQMVIDYCIRYFDPAGARRGFFTSNNMAFPTALLRAMGGFHTGFPFAAAEDRELCARWFDNGHRFRFVPGATVYHYHHMNVSRFVWQQFKYGRGAWFYNRARVALANESLKVESWKFYSGLLTSAFEHRRLKRSIPLAGLMALSQALTAAGFFYQRYRSTRNETRVPAQSS